MAIDLSLLLKLAPYFVIAILLGVVRVESGQIHKWHVHSNEVTRARELDQWTYEEAQKEAAQRNIAQVQEIEAQQQKKTDEIDARYHADLDRLRAQSDASKGHSGSASVPQVSTPSSGPSCEAVPLSGPDDLLRARETELQLNALIDWVNTEAQR